MREGGPSPGLPTPTNGVGRVPIAWGMSLAWRAVAPVLEWEIAGWRPTYYFGLEICSGGAHSSFNQMSANYTTAVY